MNKWEEKAHNSPDSVWEELREEIPPTFPPVDVMGDEISEEGDDEKKNDDDFLEEPSVWRVGVDKEDDNWDCWVDEEVRMMESCL